jgi:hypothetical protein
LCWSSCEALGATAITGLTQDAPQQPDVWSEAVTQPREPAIGSMADPPMLPWLDDDRRRFTARIH